MLESTFIFSSDTIADWWNIRCMEGIFHPLSNVDKLRRMTDIAVHTANHPEI